MDESQGLSGAVLGKLTARAKLEEKQLSTCPDSLAGMPHHSADWSFLPSEPV
jgi:hypothetical protein